MIDRRTLIALGMAVPAAHTALRLDLPDPRIHQLNTGGVHVIGISPDSSLLVGTRDRETICILDASTRETVAESDAMPELSLLDIPAMSWSPDGSKLAFNIMPWVVLRDSDIFVMDVASGEITNLTPEGYAEEAHNLMENPEANVDTSPVWLDDDTILFLRDSYAGKNDRRVSLETVSIADGKVDIWLDLSATDVAPVTTGPIWQLSDGSLLFGINARIGQSIQYDVMVVNPDKTYRVLNPDGLGHLQLIDANDTHVVVHTPETFEYWYIPLDAPAEREKLWERFELPGTVGMRSEVVLGPEPDTVLLLVENETDQTFVLRLDDSGVTEIAELRAEGGPFNVHWAEDVILITSKGPAWLISPED